MIFQVLVHGEQNEMARLKAALLREYEDDTEYQMQVHNPRNTVAVELHFRGEKMAKVSTYIIMLELYFRVNLLFIYFIILLFLTLTL